MLGSGRSASSAELQHARATVVVRAGCPDLGGSAVLVSEQGGDGGIELFAAADLVERG